MVDADEKESREFRKRYAVKMAIVGYTCALLLILSGRYVTWIWPVSPLWVFLISVSIRIVNLRRPARALPSR